MKRVLAIVAATVATALMLAPGVAGGTPSPNGDQVGQMTLFPSWIKGDKYQLKFRSKANTPSAVNVWSVELGPTPDNRRALGLRPASTPLSWVYRPRIPNGKAFLWTKNNPYNSGPQSPNPGGWVYLCWDLNVSGKKIQASPTPCPADTPST